MIARLTKRTVDALQAKGVDVFVWDKELKGFGVKVTPKDRRVFVYQYWTRPPLKRARRRATIGTFPTLAVEQAREAAQRLALRVANGEDPAGEASAARLSAKDATVAAVSEEFLEESIGKLKPRTADEYKRLFKTNIVPALGRKAIADVSLRDVTALHSANRATPSLANHVLTLLGTLLIWSESRGYRPRGSNPVSDVAKYPENYRERFLTAEEVGRLGAALTKAEREGLRPAPAHRKHPKREETAKHRTKDAFKLIPADPFAVAAIRFLALTGWRRSEALSLKWLDVDLSRGAATLPHSKTGRSYRAIGAPAVALLAALPRLHGSIYVFPSTAKPGGHLSEVRRTWESARHEAKLDDVRLHDLRHNVASWAVGGGTSLYLTGALLGHVRAETTQRYAHLQEDVRKAAADSVSTEIAAALNGKKGAKVVSLRRIRQ
jgi:integrase